MKNLFVLFFCFLVLPVFAYSSKASKFAEIEYAKTNKCKKVYINMKKEYKAVYKINFEGYNISFITYGWGDMRVKGKDKGKKYRITYVVLTDKTGNPCRSSIIFYK